MKKNTLRVLFGLTSISLLIGVQHTADAAIFKCVNAQGETYYNDKACPENDKETQLNNVKDPVGGYIPPAFKADVEVQGTKGVVVGEGENSTKTKKLLDDVSDSESTTGNKNSDDLSDSSNSNPDASNENVIESAYSGDGKRTKPKEANPKVLPTIPLKAEQVTLEPRSKIN